MRLLARSVTIEILAADGRRAARLPRRILSFPGTRDGTTPEPSDLLVIAIALVVDHAARESARWSF